MHSKQKYHIIIFKCWLVITIWLYPFNIWVDSLNFPISKLTSSVLRTSYALSACWTDIGTKSSNKSKKNYVSYIKPKL